MEGGSLFELIDQYCEEQTLEKILEIADSTNAVKIGLYLQQTAQYAKTIEDETNVLTICYHMYIREKMYALALRIALKMRCEPYLDEIFDLAAEDRSMLKQLSLMLMRGGNRLPKKYAEDEDLQHLSNGEIISDMYQLLAKELDVVEPKLPEDVYKTQLEENKRGLGVVDSSKQNTAYSIVNSLVNVGFLTDRLLLDPSISPATVPASTSSTTATINPSDWISKHKDESKVTTIASLGLLTQWNLDQTLAQIDKYQWSDDQHIKAGAMLAFGLANKGIENDVDAIYLLLSEEITKENPMLRICCYLGMGIGFAGRERRDYLALVSPILQRQDIGIEELSMLSLSLGLVFAGTANEEVSELLLGVLQERYFSEEATLTLPVVKLYCAGIALVFLQRREQSEAIMELASVIESPIGSYLRQCLFVASYMGTGDVLAVQKLLHDCSEVTLLKAKMVKEKEEEFKEDTKEKDQVTIAPGGIVAPMPQTNEKGGKTGEGMKGNDTTKGNEGNKGDKGKRDIEDIEDDLIHHCVSLLGISLISLDEHIGKQSAEKILERILHYGDPSLRKSIPIALAATHLSHPQPTLVDLLSRLSHDNDPDVALHSIFSLGLISFGTNNAKVNSLLRQLSSYYGKDANAMFVIRVAQGMCCAGKCLVELSTHYSDNYLSSLSSLSSLFVLSLVSLHMKDFLLGKYSYLFYLISGMINVRWLYLVDEDLNPLGVSVRVGTAVDVVGLAGEPRAITGFQTHTSPVLLSPGERAELVDDEYIPLSPILEGIVICKKNPNFQPKSV